MHHREEYEALSLSRHTLAGESNPPLVTQIADGENGDEMMNELPPNFMEVIRNSSATETPVRHLDRLRARDLPTRKRHPNA